ncbi:MAG: glycosyltransferase family 39 protein [Polyangiaceae bacterium]
MRGRRWGIWVTLLALVVAWAVKSGDPYANGAEGDGFYAWMFARSLVYDHDIEFKNDYAICGDRWDVGIDRGTGHPNNNFSFGQIVFWIPALEIARLVVPIHADASPKVRASCEGPRVSFVLYESVILGAITTWLMYLVARRFAGDGAAAAATGLVGVAGTNLAYAGWMVSYSHIYAAFAVALLLWATLRADEEDTLARWLLVAFALGLAVFQRPTEAAFALAPFALACRSFRNGKTKAWLASRAAMLACGVFAGALPIALVYLYLFGSAFAVPQGRYFLFLGHAHPWLVLFAPRGGLFYSAPTAWLGVIGIFAALRDRRHRFFFGAMLVGCACEVYLAASAVDWHESWGFGARRLVTLTPTLVAAAAIFCDRAAKWMRRRPARATAAIGLASVVLATIFTFGIVDASAHNAIVPDYGHAQADYYAAGDRRFWQLMDDHVGDLAVLPAEWIFSIRYDLPATSFRDATEPFAYGRLQRGDMHFTSNQLPLADERLDRISRGFVRHDGMLRMEEKDAHVVFAAAWPFATSFDFLLDVPEPCHLRVGLKHLDGVEWAGEADLPRGVLQPFHVSLPEGAFDSGMNEVVFERSGSAPIEIRRFAIHDDAIYPPAM